MSYKKLPIPLTALLCAGLSALASFSALAETTSDPVSQLCHEVGSTLGSVSREMCQQQSFQLTEGRSHQNRPLVLKEYAPTAERQPLGRVLLMGGIHGDEYSSVSLMFRWLEKLNQHHSGLFHWQVVPLLNPDGLLQDPKATRQNGNGVDLNRNFPTRDWHDLAQDYWVNRTYRNPRRYPGPTPASEPETQWFLQQIRDFQPDAIVAVHAPHHLVDFDGPHSPPRQLGQLQLHRLGTYPGSLGNYAGLSLDIPVVTVELSSAGIMPNEREISRMWLDLIGWLRTEVPKQRAAMREKKQQELQAANP